LIDILRTDDYSVLFNYLTINKFNNLEDHNEVIYYAKIFKFVNNNTTAGFVWMYEIEANVYHVHMHIQDEHKGRILTRHVVNKFYKLATELGAKLLEASPINKTLIDLYARIGWEKTKRNAAQLKLPYTWRK
tara:strand:- start:480 stop:875 length:396 start_codon:yes stop_codon:yes gene_type:complete